MVVLGRAAVSYVRGTPVRNGAGPGRPDYQIHTNDLGWAFSLGHAPPVLAPSENFGRALCLRQPSYAVAAGSSRSFTVIRKDAGLYCGPRLRKGEVFAYVGHPQNLKDLKDL